ncbi:hypothetical protein KO500_03195 [Cellulophaga baltica]|uniref:hypothetical protein n=1 Tax=Cellulophaga TaxID=104264 RepID=UPI001C068B1F|nr:MULTISPECIES: hypothetical protein [Cellulophaga]MBU2995418.1 hypothetical protein [Cellulophaga baltica]MDO6766812.1 hypothetical protein [Cellulophaga sp. 1_MG-2023]
MKTVLLTIALIFIGVTAQAQEAAKEKEIKVETTAMTIVTKTSYETSTARLYKNRNSRIINELSFITKEDIAKLS